ncbi:MAG: hypothetical protein EOP85_00710 [Verrucomicrobiaceae bacterium]|nr:MAG: hypothetical protein EOP85_00710 [Verrucomicrobiaceae bacterium]
MSDRVLFILLTTASYFIGNCVGVWLDRRYNRKPVDNGLGGPDECHRFARLLWLDACERLDRCRHDSSVRPEYLQQWNRIMVAAARLEFELDSLEVEHHG